MITTTSEYIAMVGVVMVMDGDSLDNELVTPETCGDCGERAVDGGNDDEEIRQVVMTITIMVTTN